MNSNRIFAALNDLDDVIVLYACEINIPMIFILPLSANISHVYAMGTKLFSHYKKCDETTS